MKLKHWERRPRGRITPSLCVVALAAGVVAIGTAAHADSGQTSDQVAAEIVRIQANADSAALKWTELDDEATQLANETAAGQASLDQASAAYYAMEATMAAVAVNRFMGGGVSAVGLLGADPVLQLQMNALSNVAIGAGSADLDTFETLQSDLTEKQANLASVQARNAKATAKLLEYQKQMEDQLVQLQALEVKLKDAEVKRAYEIQLAALRAKQEAAAAETAAKAEAAASAAAAGAAKRSTADTPTPTSSVNQNPAPAASSPVIVPIVVPRTPVASTSPGPATPAPAEPVTTDPPAPPSTTTPTRPTPVVVGGSWLCPVAGPTAFGDTYGDPRPGGRRHEGVDMMSPLGTPLVAVVSGFAKMKTNNLGGNVVGLTDSDGNYYYYAHLTDWEGPSRQVQAGEVIGYVGHTGDTSANHLHFEIHPGGGGAINPYPTVRSHC